MQTFDKREEALAYIAARCSASDAVYEDVIAGAVDACSITVWPKSVPGVMQMLMPRLRWVISNDDLRLFDTMLLAIGGGTIAQLFLTPFQDKSALASPVTAALVAMLTLVWQINAKGARLTELETRVLSMLRLNPSGLSASDILTIVRRGDPDFNAAALGPVLARLGQFPLPDGSLQSFMSVDTTGVYRAKQI